MRIALTCLFVLLFTGLNWDQALAQNYRESQSRVRVSPRQPRTPERFRVTTRTRQEAPPQSVYAPGPYDQPSYSGAGYNGGGYPEEAYPYEQQNFSGGNWNGGFESSGFGFDGGRSFGDNSSRANFESQFADSTTKYWGDGYYANLRGDIFGVSARGCCDEWRGHCDCLELTSTHSKCECTNPRRAHWAYSSEGGDCDSCGDGGYGYGEFERTGYGPRRRQARSNRPVSSYFHPNQYH